MEPVKSRAEQAAQTRLRLLERARELFLEQGYAATSTRQIAAAAQVTERTLFNIVASKSELLRLVVITSVVGEPVSTPWADTSDPLLERDEFARALGAGTTAQALNQFCAAVTELHQRSARLAAVVRAAADVDPGAAAFWSWGVAQQVSDCRRFVDLLHSRGSLRPGLEPAEAADSLAVLSGHETYWRFSEELGWPPERYRRWLHRLCSAELLGPVKEIRPAERDGGADGDR
jgi:AcrR family transcriptional regulator